MATQSSERKYLLPQPHTQMGWTRSTPHGRCQYGRSVHRLRQPVPEAQDLQPAPVPPPCQEVEHALLPLTLAPASLWGTPSSPRTSTASLGSFLRPETMHI